MIDAAQYLANAFDKEEGDFKLICQGKVFTAHTFILSERSGYFKRSLETDVGEVKKEMNVNAFVEEVLNCAKATYVNCAKEQICLLSQVR